MDLLEHIEWGKEIAFWLLFFFFNFSVFAFFTLINFKWEYLVPLKTIGLKWGGGLFNSLNPDFYRICLDLSLIIICYRWFSFESGYLIAALYYGIILIYNVYHYSFSKIYNVTPILTNDFRLLINAAGILWGESKAKILLFFPIFLITTSGLVIGFKKYLEFSTSVPTSSIFIGATFFLFVYISIGLWKNEIYRATLDLANRVLIMPLRIAYNILSGIRLISKSKKADFEKLEKSRNLQLNLAHKPNVYCLFIESYGSILLREKQLKAKYTKLFECFSGSLMDHGWNLRSNLSESVTPVGPSWLAYTSVLFGNRVSNNFEYEFLLSKKEIHKYDTLMKIFMKQGYTSYNLNATKPKPGVKVPYDLMKSFYGIDNWILDRDIQFAGARYGFTESPADQFVLNYAYEEVISKEEDPFILFYLTKNSHSPFVSPEISVSDWRELNGQTEELIGSEFLRKPNFDDYLKSIKYQLDFLNDFILKQGKEDDVFLLIGDHQPHDLGNQQRFGKETLVHVISKNEKFVDGFKEYGFRDGLDNLNEPVKHEAIYSLFIREIMRTYGKDGVKIPPYEPNGIQF